MHGGEGGGERSLRGLSALKNDILQSCTDLSRTNAHPEERKKIRNSFAHRDAKGPEFNNASITGQPTCSYDMYEENDLALQLLFFSSPSPPSRQLLRFDFNAFCVVLYFHAKILLYLNVFIFIKCV